MNTFNFPGANKEKPRSPRCTHTRRDMFMPLFFIEEVEYVIFSQNYFKIRVLGMTSYLHLSYHTPTKVCKSGGAEGRGKSKGYKQEGGV